MINPSNSLIADGFELDTVAHWVGLDSNRWSVPAAKGENVLVPGRHGSLYVADKTFSEGEFSLQMHVFGDTLSDTRDNIDKLLRIFTKRKSLIHFEHTMDNGDEIECYAECIGAFDITRSSAALPFAKMGVGFKIPEAFWQDQLPRTWTGPTGLEASQALRMEGFGGGSAPMDDAVYLFHGPIDEPELKAVATGAYVRLADYSLETGETWRIDAANWTSHVGPTANVNFDSGGTSVIGNTVHGGSASFLDMPPHNDTDFVLEVGGINIGPAAYVEAHGRRKHMIG